MEKKVVAWLECLPFPPVALRSGTFTIGRSDCDLVLPHMVIDLRADIGGVDLHQWLLCHAVPRCRVPRYI